MIKRTVIRLRSKHKRDWVTVILIVIFTRRMNAKKRTINQWELIIMKYTETFNIPRMMILESGVVFVVRLVVERRIMHALTLHIQKNKSPEIPQAYSLNFWTTPITSCVRREQDAIVFFTAGIIERFLDLTHTHTQYCRNP